MNSVIYETTGRAREYFQLAANLYTGCEHSCRYCYAADVTQTDLEEFHGNPKPKREILTRLTRDAQRLGGGLTGGEDRHILLSFVTDPYQPIERGLHITRRAIEILKAHQLKVAILTKGGDLATRDFDLLTADDMFGVTLTLLYSGESTYWEPKAAPPLERVESLHAAHERGIKTFVSLEPVINPDQTLGLIDATWQFVDKFLVGKLNYHEHARTIQWESFARRVIDKLNGLHQDYYIKRDLGAYIGHPNGLNIENGKKV